jgi:hypothetical protein
MAWQGTHEDGSRLETAGVIVCGVRGGRIAWARLYVEPVEQGGDGSTRRCARCLGTTDLASGGYTTQLRAPTRGGSGGAERSASLVDTPATAGRKRASEHGPSTQVRVVQTRRLADVSADDRIHEIAAPFPTDQQPRRVRLRAPPPRSQTPPRRPRGRRRRPTTSKSACASRATSRPLGLGPPRIPRGSPLPTTPSRRARGPHLRSAGRRRCSAMGGVTVDIGVSPCNAGDRERLREPQSGGSPHPVALGATRW